MSDPPYKTLQEEEEAYHEKEDPPPQYSDKPEGSYPTAPAGGSYAPYPQQAYPPQAGPPQAPYTDRQYPHEVHLNDDALLVLSGPERRRRKRAGPKHAFAMVLAYWGLYICSNIVMNFATPIQLAAFILALISLIHQERGNEKLSHWLAITSIIVSVVGLLLITVFTVVPVGLNFYPRKEMYHDVN